jgi:hypothetical protein
MTHLFEKLPLIADTKVDVKVRRFIAVLRQAIIDGDLLDEDVTYTAGGMILGGLTAGELVTSDSSGKLISSDTDEVIDDRVSALIQDGTGITWTYVDASDSLTADLQSATTATLGGIRKGDAVDDSEQSAITLTAVTDPADTPASADALRDDLVANTIPDLKTRDTELETAIETLAGEVNDLLFELRSGGILST